MTEAPPAGDAIEPAWRERAVGRSLQAARTRAEERVQRFLDAAFALIDEKGTTEFTIQEVVDRSKQSLRGFYEYFDGKDELLLALFEETVREAYDDIRAAVDAEREPIRRLRAFAVRLHEWCDPGVGTRKRGRHNRRPIADFSIHLAVSHAVRVQAALAPQSRLLHELIEDAAAAGTIHVEDTKRATALVQQMVMHSSFGNRLVEQPRQQLTAEETWEFCLRGLGG
ncbi:MAG TPA: TetR/AcrR family transcriptional regulator [Acidimicrobiia bacterium]|nr:TetR/AcrR family transcriptional regulator [Acidimicrobiia bacterium]